MGTAGKYSSSRLIFLETFLAWIWIKCFEVRSTNNNSLWDSAVRWTEGENGSIDPTRVSEIKILVQPGNIQLQRKHEY